MFDNILINAKKIINNHKNIVIALIAITILACVGISISHSFLQEKIQEPIIGGKVGTIADVDARILVQKRDNQGNAISGYELYDYPPQAGYFYNSNKSYCNNGGTISYNSNTYEFDIDATEHDICYIYFDAIDGVSLDLIANVYKENIDLNGSGTGTYGERITDINTSYIGYKLNETLSSCRNNSTISFDIENGQIEIESTEKDNCNIYMDVISADLDAIVYLQEDFNSNTYNEMTSTPNNVFFEVNYSKTSCTNGATSILDKQEVVISSVNKAKCNIYLDIGTGPIIEEVTASVNENVVTLNFSESTNGTQVVTWYYSFDGGEIYQSTNSPSVRVSLTQVKEYSIAVYGVDVSGNESSIIRLNRTTSYEYIGEFTYSSLVQTKKIEVEGKYKLEVWGAEGGYAYNNSSTYPAGKGGYSYGVVHLNAGDVLYIHTGGQGVAGSTTNSIKSGGVNGGGTSAYTNGGSGGGGTDIRINTDNLYSRVIVAGGGGGAGYYTSRPGGAGGGVQGASATGSSYNAGAGTMIAGGAAGGYTKGTAGSFGQGGNAINNTSSYARSGGGGGGWYGGGGGGYRNSSTSSTYRASISGGGGGSGWIYNAENYTTWSSTTEGQSGNWTLNSDYYLTDAETQSGNGTITFKSPTGTDEAGHSGNGYARVTYIPD